MKYNEGYIEKFAVTFYEGNRSTFLDCIPVAMGVKMDWFSSFGFDRVLWFVMIWWRDPTLRVSNSVHNGRAQWGACIKHETLRNETMPFGQPLHGVRPSQPSCYHPHLRKTHVQSSNGRMSDPVGQRYSIRTTLCGVRASSTESCHCYIEPTRARACALARTARIENSETAQL